jgi:5'-phosphate synthase pdxT subunit
VSDGLFRGIFIRAPLIVDYGENVEILCEYEENPVMARQGNVLVSSFHPELTEDTRVHELFLKMI